jgi:hypothetical protein
MMGLAADDDDSSAALSSLLLGQLGGDNMGAAATVTKRVCTTRVVHAGQTMRSTTTTTVEHLGTAKRLLGAIDDRDTRTSSRLPRHLRMGMGLE